MNCIIFIIFTLVIFGVFICLRNNNIFNTNIIEGLPPAEAGATEESGTTPEPASTVVTSNDARRLGDISFVDPESTPVPGTINPATANFSTLIERNNRGTCIVPDKESPSILEAAINYLEDEGTEATPEAINNEKEEIFQRLSIRCSGLSTQLYDDTTEALNTTEELEGYCTDIPVETGVDQIPCVYIPGITGNYDRKISFCCRLRSMLG